MKTHTVIYGAGAQTLWTVPTTADGEPMLLAAAEARIVDLALTEDSADRDIVSQAAATLDSTTDTTTAAVGSRAASRRKIEVGTPANFTEGRSYAIVSTTGEREEVVVDHVDAEAVYARDDIRRAYPIGSTLRGIEVSVVFPSATADDEDEFNQHETIPFAVDWFLTDGDPAQLRELIYIRRNARPMLARIADVWELDWQLDRLTRDNNAEKALSRAHKDFYRRLEAAGVDADTANYGEHAKDFVVYRTAFLMRRNLGTERDDEIAAEYKRTSDAIFRDLGGFGQVNTERTTDAADEDPIRRHRPWGLT